MSPDPHRHLGARALDLIERVGNRLPDPSVLFVVAAIVTAGVSASLDGHRFTVPSVEGPRALSVESQLAPEALAGLLGDLVDIFTGFRPLGVVLVALLGVGVAEGSGLVQALLRLALSRTSRRWLTPLVLVAGLLSHSAADAGYVVVLPLAAVLFGAAGRHPMAGLAAGFAGVGGGFSANPFPSALDPLLQGLTQEAAQLLDPNRLVNPLCNWAFTATSCLIIVGVGWWITDRVVEPRLGPPPEPLTDDATMPRRLQQRELRALAVAGAVSVVAATALVLWALPEDSALRSADGGLTSFTAPLMQAIVSFIFIGFLLPGLAYGFVAGTFESHRDVVASMTRAMESMGGYLVMAFFASIFIEIFSRSGLGALSAVEGADFLQWLGLPDGATLVGLVLVCAAANLLIGSASAKWALLAPVLVPMFMRLGLAPELVQAAYRIGDSASNVVTPLNPYFPLVLSFAARHAGMHGIGSILATMVPYAVAFLAAWVGLLGVFWAFEIPLGIQGHYVYP
jgi:aminobenzoyl-glutamate transport protein